MFSIRCKTRNEGHCNEVVREIKAEGQPIQILELYLQFARSEKAKCGQEIERVCLGRSLSQTG